MFCCLLDEYSEEFFLQLENAHDIEGQVDVFESVSTFVVLCNDDFEEKLKFIFQLFDFDHSETIEGKELTMSL